MNERETMDAHTLEQFVRAAAGDDPLATLRAIPTLQQEVSGLEAVAVRHARVAGLTWAQIADALGVSRQAVHHKHGGSRFSRG